MDKKANCSCGPDCTCGCQEGKTCTCDNQCDCQNGSPCSCGDDCKCKDGKSFNEQERHSHDRHHGAHKLYGLLLLAFGIALGGFFPGYYYYHAKMNANSVVVKGLAEMDVKADLAIWDIKFVVTGNDVVTAQQEMARQTSVVENFLIKNGVAAGEINVGRLETNDLMANPYRTNTDNNIRFILTQNISVKSTNVDNIAKVLNKSGELVAKGIIFNQDYGYPVSYLFTKLNQIKPLMLAEATKNAKDAAEEFAKNSGSRVGRIRQANQGVFSILPREQTMTAAEMQQIEKKVRVVSTIEYWLE